MTDLRAEAEKYQHRMIHNKEWAAYDYTQGANRAIEAAIEVVSKYCEPSHLVIEQLKQLLIK